MLRGEVEARRVVDVVAHALEEADRVRLVEDRRRGCPVVFGEVGDVAHRRVLPAGDRGVEARRLSPRRRREVGQRPAAEAAALTCVLFLSPSGPRHYGGKPGKRHRGAQTKVSRARLGDTALVRLCFLSPPQELLPTPFSLCRFAGTLTGLNARGTARGVGLPSLNRRDVCRRSLGVVPRRVRRRKRRMPLLCLFVSGLAWCGSQNRAREQATRFAAKKGRRSRISRYKKAQDSCGISTAERALSQHRP